MLRKLRLTAAIVLVCAIFLPLSECSQGQNHPQTTQKSLAQRVYPQSNTEFSYQYGYRSISFDLMGVFTLLAFAWPVAFALFVRRNLRPRMKWAFRILELLLCAGTIYWLNVISFRSFGATWLYGAYIGVIAVAVFTGLGIAAWFAEGEVHRSGSAVQAAVVLFIALIGATSANAEAFASVRDAEEFAIGGIGVAGTLSKSELALREVRDGPRADEQLRKILNQGTQAGRLYALYGLRQLGAPDYDHLVEPFRSSNAKVKRIQGCMISEAQVSEVVKWIDQYAKDIRTWEKNTPQR